MPMERAPEAPSLNSPQEFEFTANGQQIKVPYSDNRLKRWAEMGYTAPNQIGRLNQELQTRDARIRDFEGKFKDYETKYKPYQDIDTWARQNPQAWQTLEANWKNQIAGMSPNQISQLPPEVQQKLEKLEDKFSQIEQKETMQREFAADHGLDQEIQSIRKNNPNIDFGNPRDPNSLEMMVLNHGIQNGIPSFRAAFRDYFFDQHTQMAQEKGRESAGKALQRTKGLGLPGSPVPKGRGSAPDLKNMDYNSLTELAMKEFGIVG